MSTDYRYEGSELDLFAEARRWKRYWTSVLRPYIGRSVLDVGAGIGATAAALAGPDYRRWVALEPDPGLTARMLQAREDGRLPACLEARQGGIDCLAPEERFDSILYIDVLEHIADDAGELQRASAHLEPGGRLLILAPAHGWLYTPFDAAIGHHRRYNRRMLEAIQPAGLRVEQLRYLDSAGMLASLGNRLLMRSAHPTRAQIQLWDRGLVPLSRLLDPVLGGHVGKSIVCVFAR